MLLRFENIWTRNGQLIRLRNYINISETPNIHIFICSFLYLYLLRWNRSVCKKRFFFKFVCVNCLEFISLYLLNVTASPTVHICAKMKLCWYVILLMLCIATYVCVCVDLSRKYALMFIIYERYARACPSMQTYIFLGGGIYFVMSTIFVLFFFLMFFLFCFLLLFFVCFFYS